VTERIENLAKLFKTAKLPFVIKKDIENKIIGKKTARIRKTARKITVTLKAYLRAIQKAGVSIDPPMLNMVLKFPNLLLDLFFMTWLRTKMVRDMMLPDYANNANNEIVQLSHDLMKFLSQKDIKSVAHSI